MTKTNEEKTWELGEKYFATGQQFAMQNNAPVAIGYFTNAATCFYQLYNTEIGKTFDVVSRYIAECNIAISQCKHQLLISDWQQNLIEAVNYLELCCQINHDVLDHHFRLAFVKDAFNYGFPTAGKNDATRRFGQAKANIDNDGFSQDLAVFLGNSASYAYSPLWDIPNLYKFGSKDRSNVGYIYHDDRDITIGFRGSFVPNFNSPLEIWLDALRDWITVNFNFEQSEALGGLVHKGFYNVNTDVFPAIERFLQKNWNGQDLWLTGHSMGGAVATILGQQLHEKGITPRGVYVYGSPKVGDDNFRRAYQPSLYRVENGFDLVPSLPLPMEVNEIFNDLISEFTSGSDHFLHQALFQTKDFLFPKDREYKHAGYCRWINKDGLLSKPSMWNTIERLTKTIFEYNNWVSHHNISDYLNKIHESNIKNIAR